MKVRMSRGALVLGCTLALAIPAQAQAVGPVLQLDGIQGESKLEGYENAIDIDSVQWGIGRSKDKAAAFSDVTVTKRLDRSSPELMLHTATGAAISTGVITFLRQEGGAQPGAYLRYCMTNVRVTSFSQSSGGDRPTETVSLSYGTFVMSYTMQKDDGTAGDTFTGGWDVVRNLQYGAGSSC